MLEITPNITPIIFALFYCMKSFTIFFKKADVHIINQK